MAPPKSIPGFKGEQLPYSPDPAGTYQKANQFYASSSHQKDHDMNPGLLVAPKDEDDIVAAIKYAKAEKIKTSVSSGGHQYSGACSTSQKNIMINLHDTFTGPPQILSTGSTTTMVKIAVNTGLGDLNAWMKQNELFVPHGQCIVVRVGGHAQTGGYGQLGRSFGLFGDHIRKIHIYDHDGQKVEVDKTSNAELFYAITGGSPGNFGIITHYEVELYQAKAYYWPPNTTPLGLWAAFEYDPETLEKCLSKVAEIADNPDFEHNYDLCVSVLSSSYKIDKLIPHKLMSELPHLGTGASPVTTTSQSTGQPTGQAPPQNPMKAVKVPVILIYAQWVPFAATDKYDQKWFKDLETIGNYTPALAEVGIPKPFYLPVPMSALTGAWLFKDPREFPYPYDKRTYMTNSTSLIKNDWPKVCTGQIDQVVNPKHKNTPDNDLYQYCYLSVQIQVFGGKNSKFYTNRDNGTSYSWRDSTVCQVLDCFYDGGERGKKAAEFWQAENDRIMNDPKNPNAPFSKQDKRVLWASYGNWDMDEVWHYYYEDKAKYERLGKARAAADPDGTFTPNPFAVKRFSDHHY